MADKTINDVTFLSYNPTGFGAEKVSWVRDLLTTTNSNFVRFQEHFMSQHGSALKVFSESFCDYKPFVVPATRQPGQKVGRASGGLAQLVTRSFDLQCDRIESTNSRVQAQIIQFPTFKLLWGNAYFPTDPQDGIFDDRELVCVLQEIESIMDKGGYDHVLWGGDINYDPTRNTTFTEIVRMSLQVLYISATISAGTALSCSV